MTLPPGSVVERTPWRARDAAFALVVGIVASVVALALLGGEVKPLQVFGVVVPAQSVATVVAVWKISQRRADGRRTLSMAFARKDFWGFPIGAALQIALSLVAYWVVVGLFGGDAPNQEVVDVAAEALGNEWLLVFLGVVLLVPISEEVVFRGVLLGALRRTRSDRFAVIVTAALFAAVHLLDPNAVLAVPFLFVVGIVLGRAVVKTGRLGRAVAIHAGFNGVTLLVIFAG